MSITISQAEKVLKKAGVKYSNIENVLWLRDKNGKSLNVSIGTQKDGNLRIGLNGIANHVFASYPFTELEIDEDSLILSYKNQTPLIITIK